MKLRAALAFVPLSLALALIGAAPSVAAQGTGWIRWGNWSPSAPDFDIYLNSFGGSSGMTVIKHVRYGHVSSYMALPPGQYAIAMRDSGAAATTQPTLSASVRVAPGTAYTIVSMGPASHLGVQVLTETMKTSPGKALVRVVQESVQQHRVTVTDGSRTLGGPLLLGSYTGFLPVPLGGRPSASPATAKPQPSGCSCAPTPFTRSSCSTTGVACGSAACETRWAARPCRPGVPPPGWAAPRRSRLLRPHRWPP
jgi:hypothetical protein